MKTGFGLSVVLVIAVPGFAQVNSAQDYLAGPAQDTRMVTPPPVSIENSPVQVDAERQTNYVRGDLAVSGSYVDNLFAGTGYGTRAETTFSVLPKITYDRSSSRQYIMTSYTPGFTFYQPTSELNQVNQTAISAYQFRPHEHVTVTLNDVFADTTNNGGPGYPTSVSTSFTPAVVPAFAQELINSARAQAVVQTGLNTMVGASGIVSILHYPQTSEATGLYHSSSRGSSAFISERVSSAQYVGASWAYDDYLTYPPNTTDRVQTNGFIFFYSLFPQRQLSLSVAAGPQNYRSEENPLPSVRSWNPYLSASVGFHAQHSGLTLAYERATTGGGGMVGAFKSSNAVLAARWQMTRTWLVGLNGNYANNHNVAPTLAFGTYGGHMISGGASVEHQLSEQLGLYLRYSRLHETYTGVPSILANPDSNQETVTVSWHFTRPFGY